MREVITSARNQRQEISKKATVDIKRTGSVKLPEKVQGEIKSILDDILNRDQDYFDEKINTLVQKTKLSKTEIITLFNESLDRLFLMLYRSVNNDEHIFGKIFSPEDIQRHIETLLFDFYRMTLLLVKKNDKINHRKDWMLSKVAQQILSKQLPYLNVSSNVLNNKELLDFFNLSTLVKILSKKGNEAEEYLSFCLKLSRDFLQDNTIKEYLSPAIVKEVILNSGDRAELYFDNVIKMTNKILEDNHFLSEYCSKRLIGRIVVRKGINSEKYLQKVNGLFAEVNKFLEKVLPESCNCSIVMEKIIYLSLGKLKNPSLEKIEEIINRVKNIINKIDWDKYSSQLLPQNTILNELFDEYKIPKDLQSVIESIVMPDTILINRDN